MDESGTRTEIEIKLKVASVQEGLDKLALLPAELEEAPRFEDNEVYDTASGSLGATETLLRLRVVGERATVTLKEKVANDAAGGAPRAKVRTETETVVAFPDALRAVFARVGLVRVYRYQKYRSYHAWTDPKTGHQLAISLDDTPIGVFMELEGEQASIESAAAAMGFAASEHIIDDYRTLHKAWAAQRGQPFGDMVFDDVAEGGRQGG